MKNSFYLSLQYSAIQKTVLRHDRLWSIAGISNMLSRINEIYLSHVARNDYSAFPLVAGGGKFTARFDNKDDAESAKKKIIKQISTTLPMLEFQVSEIEEASIFKKLKEKDKNIITKLNDEKSRFRGYGLTFNPHVRVCHECGEYPAIIEKHIIKGKPICSVCCTVHKSNIRNIKNLTRGKRQSHTTIEQIYQFYFDRIDGKKDLELPLNFDDLFADDTGMSKERKRMAVWFSDLNSMGDKVSVWMKQDENKILDIFKDVTNVNIRIVGKALSKTFKNPLKKYIPFRIIVAGGDDLCIVMAEQYIIDFSHNLSKALNEVFDKLNDTHPLSNKWLAKNSENSENKNFGPYCFGGSFIVTSIHTPFKKIHEVGENLMKKAKVDTDRKANSINWRVMAAEEDPLSDTLVTFEKPLFVDKPDEPIPDRLSFSKYIEMCRSYSEHLSGSQAQQIITKIIEFENDSDKVEQWLMGHAMSEEQNIAGFILVDNNFRHKHNNKFQCSRLATMLELMSIEQRD